MVNEDTSKFLKILHGDHPVTFQTYDDDKERKLLTLATIRHGSITDHHAHLKRMNSKGAGVSVLINEGDGRGRSKENVVRVKVLVLDTDGAPLEPVIATGLTPHMIVESSPGKYHVYWMVSDCPLDQFENLQQRLAERFDGDKTITDYSRVMRIPGFYHMKGDPFQSRLIETHEDLPKYTVEQIDDGLELPELIEAVKPQKKPEKPVTSATQKKSSTLEQLQGALPYIDPQLLEYCQWRDVGFALKHGLGDDGFDMFQEWSLRDPVRFSEKANENFWEDIKGTTKTPVTVGYIYKLAKQHGWSPTPDYVEELNRDFFVTYDAGKTLVFRVRKDPIFNREVLDPFTFTDFRNLYSNKYVEDLSDEKEKKTLGAAWLEHTLRRQYYGLVMEPMKDVPGYYNLWRGYPIPPLQGSWDLMKEHILINLCGKDQKLFKYVMGWLANMVQNPGVQGQVALVLKGGRGTGKGVFGNCLCKIMGQHAQHVTHSKHVTSQFNAHLEDCIFLFADEAFFAGDKQAENQLKSMITEPTLTIERKGKDVKQVRNMLHILMASNNDWVVPAGPDERRYCVLNVSDARQQDHGYFRAIKEEMDAGGLSAMLYDLLNYDLSQFDVRVVPQTDALLDQKLQSLDPVSAWWYSRLEDGSLFADSMHWGPIPTQMLYDEFIRSATKTGGSFKPTNVSFGMKLKALLPGGVLPKKSMVRVLKHKDGETGPGKREAHYVIPSLDKCRKQFELIIRSPIRWYDEERDDAPSTLADILDDGDQGCAA